MEQQTAKEKAQELVNRFLENMPNPNTTNAAVYVIAKECALICCSEVLGYMGADRGYSFWIEVKQEIEKL